MLKKYRFAQLTENCSGYYLNDYGAMEMHINKEE